MQNNECELLGELLIRTEKATERQVQEALAQQKKVKKKIGEILVDLKVLSEDDLMRSLSLQWNIPIADREIFAAVDLALAGQVPEPFAREYRVVPLRKKDNVADVAMNDPEDITTVDNLKKILGCPIRPFLATRANIERAIKQVQDAMQRNGEMAGVLSGLDFQIKDEAEGGLESDSAKKEVDDAPIVKLVNIMLNEALKERATDIHIEPTSHEMVVRYRIDGALQVAMQAPLKSHHGVVSRIKILSKLNIAESRLTQDGRFSLKMPDRDVDVRVSILPTIFGEKIVLRLLDKMSFDYKLTSIGFDQEDYKIFDKCIRQPYGIVIISGPTGSGKSTTLYSALSELKSTEDNIVTVEDPVEYQLEGISQVAVNDKIGLSFANTLRSVLRQDPDKILIGEIRDAETADIALKFALTGHLVFTTLHANDAPTTITRLVDIGMQPFLVGSSLILVMAQRLVRRICTECKEETRLSEKDVLLLGLTHEDAKKPVFRGKGCARCRKTGYYGRVGIFEIMPISAPVRKLIFSGADQDSIRREAVNQKMRTLRDSAVAKMFLGVTTVHEVLKTTIGE